MNKMPEDLRTRVLALRIASKTGTRLTEEEQDICAKAFKYYPDDYADLNIEVNLAAFEFVCPRTK